MSRFINVNGAGEMIHIDGTLHEKVNSLMCNYQLAQNEDAYSVYKSLSNVMFSRKVLVFHHDDADGYCSAGVINSFERTTFQSIIENICISDYKAIMETYADKIQEADVVYLVDLSFKEKQISYLIENSNFFIWIDHHDSSLDAKSELEDSHKDKIIKFLHSETGISAAALCWIFAHIILNCKKYGAKYEPEYMVILAPPMVKYVSLYDTFHPDMTEEFSFGITAVGLDSDFSYCGLWGRTIEPYMNNVGISYLNECSSKLQELYRIADENIEGILSAGKIAMKWALNFYKNYRKDSLISFTLHIIDRDHDIDDNYRIAALNIDANSFAFGEAYDTHDAVIKYVYQGNGKYKYSMYANRANPHYLNCKYFAECFGGGGHAGAAGWSCNEDLIKKYENGYTFVM